MNRYTDEEIIAKAMEIWSPHADINVPLNTDDLVLLGVSQMYEYVETSFAQLLQLSEFFGTKQIGDSRYSSSGCETCDYGSSYSVTFRITPEPKEAA